MKMMVRYRVTRHPQPTRADVPDRRLAARRVRKVPRFRHDVEREPGGTSMNEGDRLTLASAWLRGQQHDSTDDQWAIMDVQDLVAENPDEAREDVQVLVEHAATD